MNKKLGVSFISSYIPRQCGIATFTNDLSSAFNNLSNGNELASSVTALNDISEGYKYPKEVKFEIKDKSINDFKEAAYYLNLSDKDIINLQHEFGLYGGEAGSHILYLLENLKKPVVTTFHTVLENPNDDQQKVIEEIARYSSYLIVQSEKSFKILEDVYKIKKNKIFHIPHGAHDVPFLDTTYYKEKFQLTEKKVLLTFGLLSAGKGIEDVINSLVKVVRDYPDVVYIVLGATHPHVRKQFGESYRNSLENLVKKNQLENNVIFINRFVNTEELLEFILMSDIYVSPYHNKEQIVSGTLTYALASGKAIISTPYWYAEEILKEERGLLVPFKDPDAISNAISDLLGDENKRNRLRRNAYEAGRKMVWPEAAKSYAEIFQRSIDEFKLTTSQLVASPKYKYIPSLPEVNLSHLKTMTDTTGIIQHAVFSIPNRNEGYCIDDNARALLACIMNKYLFHDPQIDSLLTTYLTFIHHAHNKETGLFMNFMSYQRDWLEESGSEDSNGRTLFVLGYYVKNAVNHSHLALSKMLFDQTIKSMEKFTSLRSISYLIMGCIFYLQRFSGAREVKRICRKLLERLYDKYCSQRDKNWKWFENYLTYDNARLSQALMMGGIYFKNTNYLTSGLESIVWLFDVLYDKDRNSISLIGNDGWYNKGAEKARFDQQPIEIPALIDACYQAYLISEDMEWINKIGITFSWFLGNNDRQEPLYDFISGGCFDGLTSAITNQNQGAESTISWLTSLHRMYRIRQELQVE
jgi:glycosyltransferase involved in cell wall biosynthesis